MKETKLNLINRLRSGSVRAFHHAWGRTADDAG